jgi:hypothetical protein
VTLAACNFNHCVPDALWLIAPFRAGYGVASNTQIAPRRCARTP